MKEVDVSVRGRGVERDTRMALDTPDTPDAPGEVETDKGKGGPRSVHPVETTGYQETD